VGPEDPHDLHRFVEAQDRSGTYDRALSELRAGRKESHWMWFVFPQLAGLGRSQMARAYAIASIDEARAYLDHPTLGPRLSQCCRALLSIERRSAIEILGEVDAIKLRSSMTLFARAGEEPLFLEVLGRYYGGIGDPETERRL
jgi:uncharacterized protein (DUF1810 family)